MLPWGYSADWLQRTSALRTNKKERGCCLSLLTVTNSITCANMALRVVFIQDLAKKTDSQCRQA